MATRRLTYLLLLLALVALLAGCPKKGGIEPEDTTTAPPEVETAPAEEATPPPTRVEDRGFPAQEEVTAAPLTKAAQIREINDAANRLLSTVYFGFDRYDLTEDTLRTLKDNATTLKANPSWQVRVEGHCDERGTIEYNLELGAKRARAVADYLISLGIPADRILTRSYGEERPADQGHDEAAWSKNRRGEFIVTDI